MLKVGITGGIGSGKTIVCKVFEQLGVPVYSADAVARELVANDTRIKLKIKECFGSAIYSESGNLDRKKLAEIVFNDKQALEKLNSIVHPAVRSHFLDWLSGIERAGQEVEKNQSQPPYILKEAAIVFESGAHKDLDAVITVTATDELKIKRVMKRDAITRHEVEQRMKNQMSDEDKIGASDYVINNDDSSLVIPQIIKIHEDIIRRADTRS